MFLIIMFLNLNNSLYSDILQELSAMMGKESNAGVLDNISGAVAKLIINNSSIIPLEEVILGKIQVKLKDINFLMSNLGFPCTSSALTAKTRFC